MRVHHIDKKKKDKLRQYKLLIRTELELKSTLQFSKNKSPKKFHKLRNFETKKFLMKFYFLIENKNFLR